MDNNESSHESNDGKEYIYPIAPKVQNVTESTENVPDINTTPAFECIDELFANGEISGAKAAKLKSKYQQLLDYLKVTREAESRYLVEGKELLQLTQKQYENIEEGELFPTGEDNSVNRLRTELLKHGNELAACNERIYQMEFNLDSLQEEKHLLEKEFQRLPKKEEIEKQKKDNSKDIEDLKLEVAQRVHEIKSLTDESLTRDEQFNGFLKELEQLEKEEQFLKEEMVKIHNEPSHISKQSELLVRQKRDIEERNNRVDLEISEIDNELLKMSEKKGYLLEEKEVLMRSLENLHVQFEEKEKEVDLVMKECDLAKERQAELLGDRTTLDLNMKHAYVEKKSEHDVYSRKVREKDRDLKNLKKAELQIKVVKDGFQHTKSIYDKVKGQVDAQPKDDGSLLEKRKELQREVDIAKRAFGQQNSLTAHERQKVELGCQEEERLLSEQGQLRIDVVDLTRLAQIKADEREQKARDYLKAELRYHKAIEDLKTKELSIQDSAKKFVEVQKRLEDFAKLYDIIKNERNKCVNLIQTSTQRAAEMQEKIKILQNEIEILRTAASAKERQLQKSKLKHANAVVIRDSLRNEVSKQHIAADELKEHIEQQRLAISKLNELINKAEENMVELRRRYENAVQERNRRGIQLIERNEEVCVLFEKTNVQGSIIRNGDMELQSREEEIRFLKMEANDLKRSIDLLRSNLPNKKFLDNELCMLQLQLAQCQDNVLELEKNLEDPSNAARVRLLTGNDPKPDELNKKMEELEKRLAFKEEQVLEKDLVFDQVNRLVGRIHAKSDCGKNDTVALAKKVNEVQAKIKDQTRKMMAMVSELSMNQAMALKLNQESKFKTAELEKCYMRMERGEPPSDEIEYEWLRILRKEVRRMKDLEEKAKHEEEMEHYQIPGGIITTAEPRPNAYIPDDGTDLPLPRPYGVNAPFKPTELGSNMRHIRKPVIKPIEI